MKLPCIHCGGTITFEQRVDGWLDITHNNPRRPTTIGYSYFPWEVRILGGYEEAVRRIYQAECQTPKCDTVMRQKPLHEEFKDLEPHYRSWNKETIDRFIESGGFSDKSDHGLEEREDGIYCKCGVIFPLVEMEALEAKTLGEGVDLL